MCPKCGYTGQPIKPCEHFAVCPRCRTILSKKGAPEIEYPEALCCPQCAEPGTPSPGNPRGYVCEHCNLMWDTDHTYNHRFRKTPPELPKPTAQELERWATYRDAVKANYFTDTEPAGLDIEFWQKLMEGPSDQTNS